MNLQKYSRLQVLLSQSELRTRKQICLEKGVTLGRVSVGEIAVGQVRAQRRVFRLSEKELKCW